MIEHIEEVRCLRVQPGDLLLVQVPKGGTISEQVDQVTEMVKMQLPEGLRNSVKVILHDDTIKFTVVREESADEAQADPQGAAGG